MGEFLKIVGVADTTTRPPLAKSELWNLESFELLKIFKIESSMSLSDRRAHTLTIESISIHDQMWIILT